MLDLLLVRDVYVNSGLFPRKEEQSELSVTDDGRCHAATLAEEACLGHFSDASGNAEQVVQLASTPTCNGGRADECSLESARVCLEEAGVQEVRGKQWRWVRTKIRHLLDLGVSLKTAIQHGVSSKSYWHMARTPAVQQVLSNAWLKAQGLVSVQELWCKAQGYTT